MITERFSLCNIQEPAFLSIYFSGCFWTDSVYLLFMDRASFLFLSSWPECVLLRSFRCILQNERDRGGSSMSVTDPVKNAVRLGQNDPGGCTMKRKTAKKLLPIHFMNWQRTGILTESPSGRLQQTAAIPVPYYTGSSGTNRILLPGLCAAAGKAHAQNQH